MHACTHAVVWVFVIVVVLYCVVKWLVTKAMVMLYQIA